MILTITLILAFLVAVNFFLLFFSCNKTTKKEAPERIQTIKVSKPAMTTTQLPSTQLAPTGS